jgi:hypothetical protein
VWGRRERKSDALGSSGREVELSPLGATSIMSACRCDVVEGCCELLLFVEGPFSAEGVLIAAGSSARSLWLIGFSSVPTNQEYHQTIGALTLSSVRTKGW